MSSILAEKYANLLTMQDIVSLFHRLEKVAGSRSEAARMCGLERRTVYGWQTTREIRSKTRERILAALLEGMPEDTLEFLTRKSVESSTDVLRTYLSAMYEKAMSEGVDNQEFSRLAIKFDQTTRRYAGLSVENLQPEISVMLWHTSERAKEIGVAFQPLPNDLVRLTQFSRLIPNLVKAVSALSPYVPDNEIASTFNIPAAFVSAMSTALHENYIAIRAVEPAQERIQLLPRDQGPAIGTLTTGELEEPTVWVGQTAPGPISRLGGAT